MKPDDVRVISPFVGGAFGSGLRPQYQVVLAVLASRALQRSVRLVLTRQQMYGLCNRPATIERVALGATADGTLDAVIHEAIAMTSQYEDFSRNDTVRSALQKPERQIRAPLGAPRSADALRHAGAGRGHRRLWT
jgi:xanthine dehydrogenase YagR molybdenum-binding subunit